MFISPYLNPICEAIDKQLVVELRYRDDTQFREFDPYWLYVSTTGKTLLGGWQERNPNKPQENNIYHKFDLSLIRELIITGNTFKVQLGIPITRPKDCINLIRGLNGF